MIRNLDLRKFVAIAFLALALGGQARAQTPEVVRLAVDEWCPLICVDNGKVINGFLVETLTQAMQLHGYKVEFVLHLDSRAINEMKGSALQGSIVGPRDHDLKVSDAVGYTRECFYTLSDSQWTYTGVDSLDTVSLGISDDFSFEMPELDQHIEKNRRNHQRIDIAHGDHASVINFNKLLGMRFQVLAEDEAVMAMLIDKMQARNKVRLAGCAGKPVPFFIGFFQENAHSDDYVRALNTGMKQLATNGQLAALRLRYNLPDISSPR